MGKMITAVKKAVAKKVAPAKVEKTESKSVCPNCDDSGMTCSVCGTGKVQD